MSLKLLIDTKPNQTKDTLLQPKIPVGRTTYSTTLLTLSPEDVKWEKVVYRCGNCGYSPGYFSEEPGVICPNCKNYMHDKLKCVPSPEVSERQTSTGGNVELENAGFVKGIVTNMVMDDLVVKPMSTISSIALLNKLNVQEVGALQEKLVDLPH
ncbi:OLC1v1028406C1 [Oldenlandia corymbosa var. corymbosa]|uniref:OLC1v1028406C1 n=1 Tax=Oldenlandia corymbosa var. corymbosa TaxID=529605 RepID=A0AAV1CEB0_OLDCO|nr:OLC1v1028406C1 [Oldenlandia corymbosa var. corymbosa]